MCLGRVSMSVSTTHVGHIFEQKCRCYVGYMLILSGLFDLCLHMIFVRELNTMNNPSTNSKNTNVSWADSFVALIIFLFVMFS